MNDSILNFVEDAKKRLLQLQAEHPEKKEAVQETIRFLDGLTKSLQEGDFEAILLSALILAFDGLVALEKIEVSVKTYDPDGPSADFADAIAEYEKAMSPPENAKDLKTTLSKIGSASVYLMRQLQLFTKKYPAATACDELADRLFGLPPKIFTLIQRLDDDEIAKLTGNLYARSRELHKTANQLKQLNEVLSTASTAVNVAIGVLGFLAKFAPLI